jgi:tRNA (guanine-N7-)-methyltransferase
MNDGHRPIRTFGRLRSRPIKPAQAGLLDTLLPRIATPSSSFDPAVLAPWATETWMEIGFGGGEHLAAQAGARPDVLYLGAEPFTNGLASALRHIDARGLENVRIHPGDARDLMAALPDASLTRVFILFPDPWPKARHRKRRLIDDTFVGEAARLLRPAGRLRFATDWADYANRALESFSRAPGFGWTAEGPEDWRRPPADHVTTRYEEKRLGDCAPVWLEFARF